MYGFSSYYWKPDELSAEDLQALRTLDDVTPELPGAGYATRDRDGLLAAYTALLRSGDVRARGIALDQYHYSEAQSRWGQDNPLTTYDDEVLAQARALLAQPHHAPDGVAAWSSALAVLCHLGEGSDLPRLMDSTKWTSWPPPARCLRMFPARRTSPRSRTSVRPRCGSSASTWPNRRGPS